MEKTGNVFLRNAIALIVGLVLGYLVIFVVGIVVGYLFSLIPLLTTILSWPSTPALYTTTLICGAGVMTAVSITDKIAIPGKSGAKPALKILGVIILLYFALCAVVSIRRFGFSDYFFSYAFIAVFGIIVASHSEKKRRKKGKRSSKVR